MQNFRTAATFLLLHNKVGVERVAIRRTSPPRGLVLVAVGLIKRTVVEHHSVARYGTSQKASTSH